MITDTERLDWLEARAFMAYRDRDPEDCTLSKHAVLVDEDYCRGKSRVGIVHSTLRECIDEAIQARRAKP